MDISLREIQENDLEQIMEWRMRPDITRFMNTDPVLTLEKQREWLTYRDHKSGGHRLGGRFFVLGILHRREKSQILPGGHVARNELV